MRLLFHHISKPYSTVIFLGIIRFGAVVKYFKNVHILLTLFWCKFFRWYSLGVIPLLSSSDSYILFVQQSLSAEGSAIDLDLGPPIDAAHAKNYKSIKEILLRLIRLCVQEAHGAKKPRKHEQRLLRNMGAHQVVLELLQIPYDKVSLCFIVRQIHYD